MRIGIRGHDVAKGNLFEVASVIKKQGFDYVQLVVNKTIVSEDGKTLNLNSDNAGLIAKAFNDAKVNIALLGCYFNPVHSNQTKVNQSEELFIKHLELAKVFNCAYVGTETGSYNDDKWTYNPKNHQIEAFNQVYEVFKELLPYAQKYNTSILIEPAYNHVIYDALTLKKLIDKLNDDKHINIIIDIYNLLNIDNYSNYKHIFEDSLRMFKNRIKIIHLKDFVVNDNKIVQVDVGKGVIDFKFIIKCIQEYQVSPTLIFEGTSKEGIEASLTLIKKEINGI